MPKQAIRYDRGDLELNADNARARREMRRGRKNRVLAWAAFGVVVLSIPLSVGAILASVDEGDPGAEVTTDSPGRAVAMQSLGDWLAADPEPLPGASILSWDTVRVTEAPEEESDAGPPYTIETHEFTLTTEHQLYSAVVAVQVDPVAGAAMIGTPTVMPRLPDTNTADSGPTWIGYEPHHVGESFDAGVQQWAEAFVSGDPQALRSAVNDADTSRSYIPLTGVEGVQTRVLDIGVPEDEEGDEVEFVIARVELRLTWASGEDEDVEGDEEEQQHALPVLTYDVLVEHPNSGTPRVVSWGGVGTGPLLAPYSVAVEGVSTLTIPQPSDRFSEDEDGDGEPEEPQDEEDEE